MIEIIMNCGKDVGSFNVPNVVKMYIWRASHNLLPTKANLLRRGICKDQLCPTCLRDEETINHIVWDCPAAIDVWGCSRRSLQKSSCGGQDFSQLLLNISARCDQSRGSRAVCSCNKKAVAATQ